MSSHSQIALAGVCVIRNEQDIIERFVRHNLQYLDVLVCVDNESQDQTLTILANLKQEGLPIEIFVVKGITHPQVLVANSVADRLKTQVDILFFLDADEFIIAHSPDALRTFCRELITREQVGLLEWVLGIPDLSIEDSTHFKLDFVLSSEHTHRKICVPTSRWLQDPQLSVGAGFHSLVGVASEQYAIAPEIFLLHIPFRSVSQFMVKCVQGEVALKLNPKRGKTEGYHWRQIYDLYRSHHEITVDEIVEIATSSYLQTPLLECEFLLLDPFQAIEEVPIAYPVPSATSTIHAINERLLLTIESLEKTKYTSATARIAQTANGVICYDSRDTIIGQSLESYGEWAAEELRLIQELIKPGDVVIDVGANVGVHTVRFAQLVGDDGLVYAFEPQRLLFQKLCTSITLNDLENVFAYPCGLGESNQTIRVYSMRDGNLGNFSVEARRSQSGDALIEIKTLDTFELERCNFIKIDVEGMEEAVLIGAAQTLATHRPTLYLENNRLKQSAALLNRIFSFGYDCWWHISPYYNPQNFYQNPANLFAHADRPEINILCLPQEQGITDLRLPKVTSPQEKWTDVLARE